jgi:hypothetical protein
MATANWRCEIELVKKNKRKISPGNEEAQIKPCCLRAVLKKISMF